MENTELRNAVEQAIDLIDDTVLATSRKRGEVALELLQSKNISIITRKAALGVRAEEWLKQNRQSV